MAVDVDTPVHQVTEDDEQVTVEAATTDAAERSVRFSPRTAVRIGTFLLLAVIVVASGLAAWFGYQTFQGHKVEQRQQEFLQAGRQAAVNLTTIDFADVDGAIKRVLDSSTGDFHNEFERNAPTFADVVRRAQAKSTGTVTAAGIESLDGDTGQILVTTSVETTNAGTREPQPRLWRMRVTVEKQEDVMKVSKVGFVP